MGTPRRSCLVALLAVIVSVTSKKCNTVLEGQLLIGEEGTISRLDLQDNSREAYIFAKGATKFSYSYSRNTLYYSDINTRQVYALKDQSTEASVVVTNQGEWLPWSISVDDVNDKLYLVESFSSSLYVSDLKSGDGTVVFSTNINLPIDVEIDADEGYLFVLDQYQILRAELDGSNPTPIYQRFGITDEYPNELTEFTENDHLSLSISDLEIDVKSKRIYWINTENRTVESSDYNGENRKVHFQDNSVQGRFESFASLTFLNGVVYFADDVTKKLFKIDGDKSKVILDGVEIHAITSVGCEKQPKADNPCANSQCQQFCLLSKSSQTGYRCACSVGLELADDGKSCRSVQDFILFTQDNYLRGRSLSGEHKDVLNPSSYSVGKGALIDFDAHSGTVFYTSWIPNDILHEIRLDNAQSKILRPDLLSTNTGDLAYDWVTKNLYYVTYYYADATTLSVTNVNDPTYSKVLIMNVPNLVRGLIVHPNKGYVFFASFNDIGGYGTISRLATDGTRLKVIVDIGAVKSVNALAIDFDEDMIYWTEITEYGNFVVRYANLDGQDVRTMNFPEKFREVTKLTIDERYIYGINNKVLFRVNKNGQNPVNLVTCEQPGSLDDLKILSRSLQITRPDHPCKSHKCQKFCFAVPTKSSNLKATCGCPYGEKLAEDGVSCVDNSKNEPAFLPCEYTSFKCNMQIA